MNVSFRNFALVPLLALWSLALAAGWALEVEYRVQEETLGREIAALKREIRQEAAPQEEKRPRMKAAASTSPPRNGAAPEDAAPGGDDPAPRASLAERHRRTLGYLLGTTALLSLLLAAFAHFSVHRRLARIGRSMSRFFESEPDLFAPQVDGDAISRLEQQFEAMAKRLEQEHRELAGSEERLKFALHGSNTGIWDWRMDGGHTYYSPRWKSLLGFAENELQAHAEEWLTRVHPDDLRRVMELLDAHLSGKTEFFESEHRLRRKDNTYLWVLERGMAIRRDGKASRMVGALIDISRRKEAESALQRREEEYRSVVEGITQVIFRSDCAGRLTFLNPAWVELTGLAMEASLSRPLTDFVSTKDREAVRKLLLAAGQAPDQAVEGEFKLIAADGRGRWITLHARCVNQADGSPGIAGVLTDIDAQKEAQDALARSDSERKAILDLSPDGFVFIDRVGHVVYVNPAFLAMTGLTAAEVEGRRLDELETRIAGLCAPKTPAPAFTAAVPNREESLCLAGEENTVLKWQVRSLCNEQGDTQGSVMYFRNVTRETEIDRMKSEFLSTAAHELRTPMASIFGFSELLLAREFDAATQRDLIQTIHRQTKNLIDLVNELLDLARIEARGGKSFKILEQDLGPLVINAAASQYVPAETHRLDVELPRDLPRVKVDTDKFSQCLANVLGNAVKYSPQGGTIRVSAVERSVKGRQQVGIAVRDQGIGMTPEQAARIFDRFYRADTSGAIPGTGLGMALVKEIMDIFGGQVAVDSTPGQGTEVTLWLDALPPAAKAA